MLFFPNFVTVCLVQEATLWHLEEEQYFVLGLFDDSLPDDLQSLRSVTCTGDFGMLSGVINAKGVKNLP